jgi:hypothetical protein
MIKTILFTAVSLYCLHLGSKKPPLSTTASTKGLLVIVNKNVDDNPLVYDAALQQEVPTPTESNQSHLHKYYLSVSNVTYNSKVKALQMTTRFFVDDLENVLSDRTGKKIIFNKDADLNNQKTTIATYLEKKLEVSTDGSMRSIIYIGGEIENDQVIFYTEIPVPQEPSNISMKFTAFQELFEDQKNMVHLKIKGKRGTLLMTKDKQTDFLKLT